MPEGQKRPPSINLLDVEGSFASWVGKNTDWLKQNTSLKSKQVLIDRVGKLREEGIKISDEKIAQLQDRIRKANSMFALYSVFYHAAVAGDALDKNIKSVRPSKVTTEGNTTYQSKKKEQPSNEEEEDEEGPDPMDADVSLDDGPIPTGKLSEYNYKKARPSELGVEKHVDYEADLDTLESEKIMVGDRVTWVDLFDKRRYTGIVKDMIGTQARMFVDGIGKKGKGENKFSSINSLKKLPFGKEASA